MGKRSKKKKEKNISSQEGQSKNAPSDRGLKIAICIFLVISTLTVYSQVQDHEFLDYDDLSNVTQNLNVQSGLNSESVIWAFTTAHFVSWQPITWLSHMLDYQLYGSNPKGHHLTNLLFHIASVLILFLVLLRMTGAVWQSGLVAALFALHPFNVESVAWVSERKNVLSTFFWFLTMRAYVHYVEKPSAQRYGLVALLFALGLMSKPMLVTLPFVLLMMDYWPLRRFEFEHEKGHNGIAKKYTGKKLSIWHLVWEKTPLFLLTVGSSITTFIAQQSGGAVKSMEFFSLSARLTNAMVSYLEYLKKTVWPEGLAVLYPHPGNALALWKGILCGLALVGISAFAIKFIRKAPYFAFGWFWYLGTLIPVIGIVQVGVQSMADRYAYVPLIGIFIIVAWGLSELIAKWRHKDKVLTVVAGICIPILMVITWNQVSHWKNGITIFTHAIEVTDKKHPTFAVAYYNLGNALLTVGKTEESIPHYKEAIKLNPDFSRAYNSLGIALQKEGKTEEAISHYKIAIELVPEFALAHSNFGNALFSNGKIEGAISHYKRAIKLDPDLSMAYDNLGQALYFFGQTLYLEGKTEEAISKFKTAIEFKPDFFLSHSSLGFVLYKEKQFGEAVSHLKTAIELKPDDAGAHNNLGGALFSEGRIEEAISYFKTAIKLKADFAAAHTNLKVALRKLEKQ